LHGADADVEIADIEDFEQQKMTKASYSSYFGPFLAYAVKQAWTSKFYSEFFSSGPKTSEFVQRQYAPPQMLKNYLRVESETSSAKNGSRRGVLGVGALFPEPWQINS
jgi:hypothetical protein